LNFILFFPWNTWLHVFILNFSIKIYEPILVGKKNNFIILKIHVFYCIIIHKNMFVIFPHTVEEKKKVQRNWKKALLATAKKSALAKCY
jgi:hypothetical protein